MIGGDDEEGEHISTILIDLKIEKRTGRGGEVREQASKQAAFFFDSHVRVVWILANNQNMRNTREGKKSGQMYILPSP